MTTIKYNNSFPFSGQPTPFVGRVKNNIVVGERWGAEENWTLLGQLTGCAFSDLTAAKLSLLNSFSRDYQDLEITEDGNTIEVLKYVEIDSIVFNSSPFVKILPYTISLSCYPSGFFSGVFGILDPVDRWEMTENKDRTLNLTHTVSARGFNTSGISNAYDNAKNYVLGRTGFGNFPEPEFITKYSASGTLLSQVETPNRLEGSYGITETFTLDQFNTCDKGLLRYTVEAQSPQAGVQTASINGTIQGSLSDDFSVIRARLSGFDFYSNLMYSLDSGIALNPIPVEKQVVEDQNRKLITFAYSFDDNRNPEINFDYSIVVNSGDSNVNVSLNGSVNGRGELKNRWEKAENYFKTYLEPSKFFLVSSGYSGYLAENSITGQLNPNELSSSVSYDKFNGVVSFSYDYSDKPAPVSTGLESLDFSLSWVPPLRRILPEEIIYQSGSVFSPKYEVTDLGYIPRGVFSLNGSAVPKREIGITSGTSTLSEIENAIRAIYSDYFTGYSGVYLTEDSLTQTKGGLYSFSDSWTYEGSDVLGSGSNYSEIINL